MIADIVIIVYCTSWLLLEALQLWRRKLQYLLDFENWLEIILNVTTIAFVLHHLQLQCFCPDRRTWTLGIIAVFLGWINHVVFTRQVPITGVIINILYNICFTFFGLILMAAQLMFAFALPFYMLLANPVSVHIYRLYACICICAYINKYMQWYLIVVILGFSIFP